jgi:hypothetical protein
MSNPADFPHPGDPTGIWLYGGGSKVNQVLIADITDYQNRVATPEAPLVSVFNVDPGNLEPVVPMMVAGTPSLLALDEAGGAGGSGFGSWALACEEGAPPFGYPVLIDVSDHSNPTLIAKLWLEVHDPANCDRLRRSTPPDLGASGTNLPAVSGTTNYSIERCVPYPSEMDAKVVACGGQHAGLRVWDIRDPLHVQEVAYFKGGAPRTAFLPASGSWNPNGGTDRTVDKIAGWARWVVEQTDAGPEVYLWTVTDSHGFHVLRFTDTFKSTYAELFNEVFGG